MTLVITLVRLVLTAVFGIAGVTKLLDQAGTREAVNNFGAPNSLAPAVAILLPLAELSIALGLLFAATAWWSAVAALFVLGLFVIAISVNLARGKTHDCHCFGQIYSRPLGWPTLLRNIVFAAAALLVLWSPNEASSNIVLTLASAFASLGTLTSLLLVTAMVIAAAVTFYFQRKRPAEQPKEGRREMGLPVGVEAPPFELPTYDGGTTSLAELIEPGKPLLLVFTNPNCGPCVRLFKRIGKWQNAHNHILTIALITVGTIKDNFVAVARNNIGRVLLQKDREVGELYGATATPTAVMITPEGLIATRVAGGADAIRDLLQSYVDTAELPSAESQHHHRHSHESDEQPSPAMR